MYATGARVEWVAKAGRQASRSCQNDRVEERYGIHCFVRLDRSCARQVGFAYVVVPFLP